MRYGRGGALYTLLWQINFVPISFDRQGGEVYTNEVSVQAALPVPAALLTTSGRTVLQQPVVCTVLGGTPENPANAE